MKRPLGEVPQNPLMAHGVGTEAQTGKGAGKGDESATPQLATATAPMPSSASAGSGATDTIEQVVGALPFSIDTSPETEFWRSMERMKN